MTVTADEAHTYEYVGAGLDREYDGYPVSLDVSADIAVDGKTGVHTDDGVTVEWHNVTGMPYDTAPSGVGQ